MFVARRSTLNSPARKDTAEVTFFHGNGNVTSRVRIPVEGKASDFTTSLHAIRAALEVHRSGRTSVIPMDFNIHNYLELDIINDGFLAGIEKFEIL